jgi:uncharacterized protein (TIGR02266 family)
MADEHRAHVRVPLEVEVTLESEHNFYAGIAGNVSEGGVFIATYTAPPRGAEVEIKLTLDGSSQVFSLKGVVCWTREMKVSSEESPAGCGIRFVSLPNDALKAITAFVAKRDTILFDDE